MNGASCETITSLLFGDGLATAGTCGDESTRHFTGKQHDDESNLDDFGGCYYSSQFGRFVSADWSEIPVAVPYADLTNPQTLNLYALVRGNPSTFADLDGHMAPGQLGFSGGMGITGRMRSANGNAYGCLDSGCDSYQAVWELTLQYGDGTTTIEFFDSEAQAKAAAAQQQRQQNTPGWTSQQPTSGDYVAVSDYSKSAGRFHHTGIAVDSDDTHGFSTNNSNAPVWKRIFGAPKGAMEDDLQMHTSPDGEVAPHSYLYYSITSDQAAAIQGAISDRTTNAGRYNLIFRNCAGAVESFLHAGGVSGVPHSEIFIPAVLHGILTLESR